MADRKRCCCNCGNDIRIKDDKGYVTHCECAIDGHRIDNDGDYCPENCRFVTPKENSRNRRNTKLLTVNGETKPVAEWCERLGLCKYTVYDWISKKGVAYAEQRISEIA